MLTVTKCFEFEAAHHLPEYEGPCRNLHGHSYKLEVEVGLISTYLQDHPEEDKNMKSSGMLLDFKELKSVVQEAIVGILDHRNINNILEITPTAENMVLWMAEQLSTKFAFGLHVVRIRLWETSTSYTEWKI